MSSPIPTCSSQRLLRRPPTSRHHHSCMDHHSRSLNDTPSPEYNNSLLPSLPSFLFSRVFPVFFSNHPYCPPFYPHHHLGHFPLSLLQHPDGLRHLITLPPVKENFPETSTTVDIRDSLRPPCLSIDLSQDSSPYIVTLQDNRICLLTAFPTNMILVSRYPSVANSHITVFG